MSVLYEIWAFLAGAIGLGPKGIESSDLSSGIEPNSLGPGIEPNG